MYSADKHGVAVYACRASSTLPLNTPRFGAVTTKAGRRFHGVTVAGKKLASYGFTLVEVYVHCAGSIVCLLPYYSNAIRLVIT